MKLLFLDIDGVLTSDSTPTNKNFLYPFTPSCVECLNMILTNHNVKIILTSSWRNVFDAEKQNQIFKENGVIQMPYGQTKNLGYDNRDKEIQTYLKSKKVSQFIVLDDMNIEGFDSHFIRTNPSTGLTKTDVEKVNALFKINE